MVVRHAREYPVSHAMHAPPLDGVLLFLSPHSFPPIYLNLASPMAAIDVVNWGAYSPAPVRAFIPSFRASIYDVHRILVFFYPFLPQNMYCLSANVLHSLTPSPFSADVMYGSSLPQFIYRSRSILVNSTDRDRPADRPKGTESKVHKMGAAAAAAAPSLKEVSTLSYRRRRH